MIKSSDQLGMLEKAGRDTETGKAGSPTKNVSETTNFFYLNNNAVVYITIYMPKKLSYDILITNIYTGEQTSYHCSGVVTDVVDIINKHFGLELVSRMGVVNLVSRRGKHSPMRLRCIHITRRQTNTATFPLGTGGSYPPVIAN